MAGDDPIPMPEAGAETSFDFSVSDEDMKTFARMTGDDSLIHTDDDFARANGFERRIVYGGLLLGQLSRCLGTRLPGMHGVSMEWTITYKKPVYAGEALTLSARVDQVSDATRSLVIRYDIRDADRKLRAKGTAMSMVLSG